VRCRSFPYFACRPTVTEILFYVFTALDRLIGQSLGHRYGAGRGVIWFDNLHCRGSERSLSSCRRNGLANHDCSHREDVAITCPSGKNSWYFSLKYMQWWPLMHILICCYCSHSAGNSNIFIIKSYTVEHIKIRKAKKSMKDICTTVDRRKENKQQAHTHAEILW